MLGHAPFYHEMIKKTTAMFGTLFNDLSIIRQDPTKTKSQTVKVPLLYGSKDKAYARRTEDPDTAFNMKRTYPRMAFLLLGIERDSIRKMNPMNVHRNDATGDAMYSPVPYNFTFELYIEAKHLEDGFQITEQILPFFNPEYTIASTTFPTLNLQKDIKVVLESVTFADEAPDSNFEDDSVNDWTMTFTVQSYLFAPSALRARIEEVDIFTFTDDALTQLSSTQIVTSAGIQITKPM